MKDRLREVPKLLRGQFHFVRAIRIPIQTFIHTEEIGSLIPAAGRFCGPCLGELPLVGCLCRLLAHHHLI